MIGRVIGNYEIAEKIGEGGMGAVFRGIDRMLEREVAIKALRPELASQPAVVERFRAEAITLARLNHPNIATLYSFLREGEDYFMVMEFVRGKTLHEVIKQSGPMQWNRATFLFGQALEGIDHAHRLGIIHRDIKPANIMLTDASSIKVMDFGIARALGTARLTKHGSVVGTLEYISPEQIRGLETDARSDIYSLGVLFYELLTGRVPFASENDYELMRAQIENAPPPPRTIVPEIPLIVEQAIMRALAKRHEARYETAGEFRAVLMGTLGAATNPLERISASYAAPKTRALAMPVPSSEPVIKAEASPAVPGDLRPSGGGGFFTGDQFSLNKNTSVDLASEARRLTAETDSPQTQEATRPSPLARFKRKHYIVVGIVLLALAVAVVAWIRSSQPLPAASGEAATPASSPPPPVENSSATTEQPAPVVPDENGAQPATETEVAPSPDGQAERAANETGNAGGNRTAQSRSANSDTTAVEQTVTEAPPAPQPETTQPPAVTTEPQPQPPSPPAQDETTANANTAVKKEQKKGGGFGGFMKRIFGGGKKENSNTSKDLKKP